MLEPANSQQLNASFEGRVQGVGFRMTVAEIARGFQVTGRVCNMADGSVRLVAHGEQSELQEFQQAILLRMSRFVVQHHQSWSDVRGACYLGFEIAPDDTL